MTRKGKLIAFEGLDGSGKSTQIQRLAKTLSGQGVDVVVTREPTTGSYGQQIRALYLDRSQCTPAEELALFIADRREHVETLINPALAAGQVVLTDRYYFSTAAYQGAVGFSPSDILARNDFAPVPDLVLLLELAPHLGLQRIREQRAESPNEFEKLDQLERVADIFSSFDAPYIQRISAGGAVSCVEKAIYQQVRLRMPRHEFKK